MDNDTAQDPTATNAEVDAAIAAAVAQYDVYLSLARVSEIPRAAAAEPPAPPRTDLPLTVT